jgi:prolyl-tRNA editing enzyme YbaK/EbsC (Cys-tRNA(Pro) deacylase)
MFGSEKKIFDALGETGMAYEIIEIDPIFSDTAAFCERYGYSPQQTCNTIVVTSKKGPKKYAACVVLAHTRLDVNKCVKHLLGTTRASFAPAEEVKELTGMEIGGVTPLALPAGLPIFVDERVMSQEWVILGGGSRRIKIKIAPGVLSKLGAEAVRELAFIEERDDPAEDSVTVR